jgi:hypothetical protein
MKNIESISIWDNGQNKEGVILTLKTVDGQPFKFTTFLYQILDANKSMLAQGNITIEGEEYNAWSDDDNYLFDWAAEKLNLTILGDYVEPIAEDTEPKEETE